MKKTVKTILTAAALTVAGAGLGFIFEDEVKEIIEEFRDYAIVQIVYGPPIGIESSTSAPSSDSIQPEHSAPEYEPVTEQETTDE